METLAASSLILCFHEHLNSAAKDVEFEDRYNSSIKPFLTGLYNNPEFPAALHFSGPLLERLERKKPECFLLISTLVARKQVELLGGGYYEPLLPLLPPPDKIGQIELLSTYLRRHFGKRPQGCLLPFTVWEQSLATTLRFCGMNFTFLSEAQFRAAGITNTLLSPRMVEYQGKLITAIPLFQDVFPPQAAGSPAAFMPRIAGEEASQRFFQELSQKLKGMRFEFSLPSRVLRQNSVFPRAYFPDSADGALEGGQDLCAPRDLLTRLTRVNNLYAKTFFTHTQIHQFRGDKQRKKDAREELWKAQENDAYRPELPGVSRAAAIKEAWKALLRAEHCVRGTTGENSALLVLDLDLDGQNDCLFQDKTANFFVRPQGASLFELDYLPKGWNYLSLATAAFADWFLSPEADPRGLCSSPAPFQGRFCGGEPFDLTADRVRLEAVFRLSPRKALPFGEVEVEKRYKLENGVLQITYILLNRGEDTVFTFVPRTELAFSVRWAIHTGKTGEETPAAGLFQGPEGPAASGITSFTVFDPRNSAALGFAFDTPFDLYFFDSMRRVHTFGMYSESNTLPKQQPPPDGKSNAGGGVVDSMRRVHTFGMYPESNTLPKQQPPPDLQSGAGLVDPSGNPLVVLPCFRVTLGAGMSFKTVCRLSITPVKTNKPPRKGAPGSAPP